MRIKTDSAHSRYHTSVHHHWSMLKAPRHRQTGDCTQIVLRVDPSLAKHVRTIRWFRRNDAMRYITSRLIIIPRYLWWKEILYPRIKMLYSNNTSRPLMDCRHHSCSALTRKPCTCGPCAATPKTSRNRPTTHASIRSLYAHTRGGA